MAERVRPWRSLLLACLSALLTLALAVALLRRWAPRLVGAPSEVRLVQADEHLPPFYDNAFRGAGSDETLQDPLTAVRQPGLQRARPGVGPTDLLGFRNHAVPTSADVVVLGDSQTYGLGVSLEEAWPQRLAALAGLPAARLYNMASNGWGPVQYVAMARLAGRLRPRLVVVAFYTGNDAYDAFAQAHDNPHWASLRVDRSLRSADAPRAAPDAGQRDRWEVDLGGGLRTIFTPEHRHTANRRGQAGVSEGYAIMAKSAVFIARTLERSGTAVLFTALPTKELVYAERVRRLGRSRAAYTALVRDEQANLAELSAALAGMARARYVDLLAPLRRAAEGPAALYAADADGHPRAAGHAAIAAALQPAVRALLDTAEPAGPRPKPAAADP